MARTFRHDRRNTTLRDGRPGYRYYAKESAVVRRTHSRRIRHATRVALAAGVYDLLPTPVGTEGHDTF